ncbi:hypothetical protein L0F51_00320 [Afifella sp. H1R]|uniref:hypothetical protein n=1 Tax=Afifella sp. H1R TaxID=2908841 RepID=UPI001F28D6C9|nr:hypothetical protein [Afifella sp. H1R]MCF1502209.1 hypothetical protein [Afifella sp. H1R]
MQKTIVTSPEGQIIATHDVAQGVTRQDYEAFGLVYVGAMDAGMIRRGETGFVWTDAAETFENTKKLALQMLSAEGADEDAIAAAEKTRKASTLRGALEEALG